MKWSFKIARILGIDVFLHVTFLLLLAFIAGAHWLAYGSALSVLAGLGFFLALFLCVLAHEYGHALMARKFGIETHDITLLPIGGVARLEAIPDKPRQELWVALAGPSVNVLIAALLAVWLTIAGSWEPLSSLGTTSGGFAERLFAVNLLLAAFNMIPAFPMDGGRVLRALLALRLDYPRATRIAATIGQGLAVAVGIIGLFSNAFLVLIAVFVWVGASREASATAMKAALGSLQVREAMLTDFRTLSHDETLEDATRVLLEGSQQDFPIVEHNRVVGILTHERLFEMLGKRDDWTPVGEVMEREFTILQPNEPLDAALMEAASDSTAMPVMSRGRLVGLLTRENVNERLMIRAVTASRRRSPGPRRPSRCEASFA